MILVHFQGKPFKITVIQVYASTTNTEEAEVEQLCEDLHDFLMHQEKKKNMAFSSQGTGMQKKEVKRYLE